MKQTLTPSSQLPLDHSSELDSTRLNAAYDGEGMLAKRMEVRPRLLDGIEKIKVATRLQLST